MELNREDRLKREAYDRLQQRTDKIRDWIRLVTGLSEPYARIMGLAQSENADGPTVVSDSTVSGEQATPPAQSTTKVRFESARYSDSINTVFCIIISSYPTTGY